MDAYYGVFIFRCLFGTKKKGKCEFEAPFGFYKQTFKGSWWDDVKKL